MRHICMKIATTMFQNKDQCNNRHPEHRTRHDTTVRHICMTSHCEASLDHLLPSKPQSQMICQTSAQVLQPKFQARPHFVEKQVLFEIQIFLEACSRTIKKFFSA